MGTALGLRFQGITGSVENFLFLGSSLVVVVDDLARDSGEGEAWAVWEPLCDMC